jgi:hypothetical protein
MEIVRRFFHKADRENRIQQFLNDLPGVEVLPVTSEAAVQAGPNLRSTLSWGLSRAQLKLSAAATM